VPSAIMVPVDAVMNTGRQKAVFVDRGNGYFEPRKIETGARLGDNIIVTEGLATGERIVISGNFLIDSESRFQLAAKAASAGARDPVCGMELDASKPTSYKTVYRGATYNFCSESCRVKFTANPASYVDANNESSR
jgi:YHS domain-containing protein